MARSIPIMYCHSKFFNPFKVGKFEFNSNLYYCENDKSQLYLYLYLYGLCTRSMQCLFRIYTPEGLIVLPKRDFQRIIYQIHKFGGCYRHDAYSRMLDDLAKDAYDSPVGVDRNNNRELFLTVKDVIWDSFIRTWIYTNYLDIIEYLQEKYRDINIFF